MVVKLDPNLEEALIEEAKRLGVDPEELARKVLSEHLRRTAPLQPRDDWERGLLEAARPWGVSFSDEELSRERLYD